MFPKLKLALLLCKDPQYAIAATLHLSETRFSRIILGRLQPTDDEKVRIAAYLKRDVAELFEPGIDDAPVTGSPENDNYAPLREAK